MKKMALFLILLFLSNSPIFAGGISVSGNDDGSYTYAIEGCYPIHLLLVHEKMNAFKDLAGYTTNPSLGWNDLVYEEVQVCLKESEYKEANGLNFLRKITEIAEEANCFTTNIDETNKVITIELLPGNKRLSRRQGGTITNLEGYEPILTEETVKIHNMCVIDPSAVDFGLYKEIIERPLK